MLILLTGGSACGKSSYGEKLAVLGPKPLYYIAAMQPYDDECLKKIARHRELRKDKGFLTIEQYTGVDTLELPDECQVVSFGTIFLWDVRGEYGNFWRSYRSYGSQCYSVFASAYDKYIEMLDDSKEGDSAFYIRDDGILNKDSFFMPKRNLFIQYSETDGVNNNSGYVFMDSSNLVHTADGKTYIPRNKTISVERATSMGFPDATSIK